MYVTLFNVYKNTVMSISELHEWFVIIFKIMENLNI